jgi:hypothetical protein
VRRRIDQRVQVRSRGDRSEWQRRYEESLDAERRKAEGDESDAAAVVAMEVSGCLPGALGVVALAAAAIVMLVRRRTRRQ